MEFVSCLKDKHFDCFLFFRSHAQGSFYTPGNGLKFFSELGSWVLFRIRRAGLQRNESKIWRNTHLYNSWPRKSTRAQRLTDREIRTKRRKLAHQKSIRKIHKSTLAHYLRLCTRFKCLRRHVLHTIYTGRHLTSAEWYYWMLYLSSSETYLPTKSSWLSLLNLFRSTFWRLIWNLFGSTK